MTLRRRLKVLACAPLLLGLGAQAAFALRLTDRNGVPLRRLPEEASQTRARLSPQDVPPRLVLTTLAAEDRRFFEHHGIDWKAALRAAVSDLRSGRKVSGASTITMQLAGMEEGPKARRSRSLLAKLKQAFQARGLERERSKGDILADYLNGLGYGNRTVGVESAAQLYLGKPASRLSLAEAAFLAGIPQAPDRHDPYRHPRAARKRQLVILDRMHRWGWIGEEERRRSAEERVGLVPKEKAFEAPHFTGRAAAAALRSGASSSHEVRTTLDLPLQEAVEGTLRSHLSRLKDQGVGGGAVLVLDNATGGVLAWIGSPDFFGDKDAGQVDGVVSLRQPGSALKPLLYGLAVTRGMTPADLLADIPTYEADGFRPRNYDKTYHGPVRMREALACSYNVPAVRTARTVSPGAFLELLREAGFSSIKEDASHYGTGLALGNAEVTLLELVNAYAGLARGGIWLPEKVLAEAPRTEAPRRFLPADAVYLITHILSDNDARAEAFGLDSPLHMPFQLAAKTGTSKDYRDNWAVGYTPDWTIGVWVGNPDNSPMRNVSGITGAAPILRDVALTLWRKAEPRQFTRPSSVVEVDICPLSGKTPGLWCPTRMTEVFIKGRAPKLSCDMHRRDGNKTIVVLPEVFRPWMRPESGSRQPAEIAPTPGASPPRSKTLPSISFPNNGAIFKIDPSFPLAAQKIKVSAVLPDGTADPRWSLDGKPPADIEDDHFWLGLKPGWHKIGLSVRSGDKRLASRPVSILVVD